MASAWLSHLSNEYVKENLFFESMVIQPSAKILRLLNFPDLTREQILAELSRPEIRCTVLLLGELPNSKSTKEELAATLFSILQKIKTSTDKEEEMPAHEVLHIRCVKCNKDHDNDSLVNHAFPVCHHLVLCEDCFKSYLAEYSNQEFVPCPVKECGFQWPFVEFNQIRTYIHLPQLMSVPCKAWKYKNQVRCLQPELLRTMRDPRLNKDQVLSSIGRRDIIALLTLWDVHLNDQTGSEEASNMLVNCMNERPLINRIIPVGLVCQVCLARCSKSNPIGATYPRCGHAQICEKCFEKYINTKPSQPFTKCPICKAESPTRDIYLAVFQ